MGQLVSTSQVTQASPSETVRPWAFAYGYSLLLSVQLSPAIPVAHHSPSTLTAWQAEVTAREAKGIVDIGSQQWAVTTAILNGLQAPVHKAGYMSHSFKGPSAQVHCRTEQRSSSTAQSLQRRERSLG